MLSRLFSIPTFFGELDFFFFSLSSFHNCTTKYFVLFPYVVISCDMIYQISGVNVFSDEIFDCCALHYPSWAFEQCMLRIVGICFTLPVLLGIFLFILFM